MSPRTAPLRTARPWRAVVAGVLAAATMLAGSPTVEAGGAELVGAEATWSPFLGDGAKAPKDDKAAAANDHKIVAEAIGVAGLHDRGMTGAGIDIALIDSGVADLPAFDGSVVDGIDLSFDANSPSHANGDAYGHGTHLAGLMVGKAKGLKGIAHGARVIDVKVGDRNGVVDVSQVIAALDWVIQNRRTDGRNIRIVTLAYGLPVNQALEIDPLAQAVEAAWRAGIVVVVAAGNNGTSATQLANPAAHPIVLAVGATDTRGTGAIGDDTVATFSQSGSTFRGVDVLAPGRSLLSVMPTDSVVGRRNPEARREELFLGSGTSQATAVVAAGVALLLEARPDWTPNQVKAALLNTTSRDLDASSLKRDGRGLVDFWAAANAGTGLKIDQERLTSDGSGSLQATRAGSLVELQLEDGSTVVIEGEVDWRGSQWNGSNWNGSNWNGSHWNGSNWNGSTWFGTAWG